MSPIGVDNQSVFEVAWGFKNFADYVASVLAIIAA
jgi:hypothetical protein